MPKTKNINNLKKFSGIEVVGDSDLTLVKDISNYFGVKPVHFIYNKFADTETLVDVPDGKKFKDKLVFIVSQFSFPFLRDDPEMGSINDQLAQVFFSAHQINAHRAKHIVLISPYLPYSRQSRSVSGAYIGPLQAVGLFSKAVGINDVVSCELHEDLCKSIFPLPLHAICLKDIWYKVISQNFSLDEIGNACFLSPDRGGVERVKKLAKAFGADWAFVEKKRVAKDKSVALKLIGDVKDKFVILVDDIVDTGRTSVEASKMAMKKGAKSIVACFTHGIFSEDAISIIEDSDIEKVWVSNSVFIGDIKLGSKFSVISINDLIVDFIDKLIEKV